MLKLHRHLSISLQILKKSLFITFSLVIFNNVILTKKTTEKPVLVLKITKKYIEKVNK